MDLDVLVVYGGSLALARLRALRVGGKLTVGSWVALVEEQAQALRVRLRGGIKKISQLVEEQKKQIPEGTKPQPTVKPDGRTKPSGRPDPNAKPRGPRAKQSPKDDASTKRSAEMEDEAADILAEHGYDVEQKRPPSSAKNPGERSSDFEVEGKPVDCYSPTSKNKSVRGIWSEVQSKIPAQTKRIVINLADWEGDINALKKQFADYPIEGMEELIIITKDKSIQHLFP